MILNNKLFGGAREVLHAIFFRRALPDGDLPSKMALTSYVRWDL